MAPIIISSAPSLEELREGYSRLRKAVVEEPEATGHWLLLADICLRLGRKEEAKALVVKTIERDPGSRPPALELLKSHLSESELARLPLARERIPFYQDAASILRYPTRGNGPALLVGGALVFTALAILARITSIFFWIPALFTAGYLASYSMIIIESSARGHRDPPDYPDFASFWDSVLGPFWIALCASVIPSALPIAYLLTCGPNLGVVPFVALGLAYLPMALITGAMFQSSLAALNVVRIVRAIRSSAKEYLVGVVVIYGLVFVSWLACLLAEKFLPPLAGVVTIQILDLYFLLAEMHILGRIYLNHEREIGWFGIPR